MVELDTVTDSTYLMGYDPVAGRAIKIPAQALSTVLAYVLPIAAAGELGGVKGGGINVTIGSDGTINFTLPTASPTELGGIIIGSGLEINDGVVSVPALSGNSTIWQVVSGGTTSVGGGSYLVNLSSGNATLNFPSSPAIGTAISVIVSAGTTSNQLLVNFEGANFNSSPTTGTYIVNILSPGIPANFIYEGGSVGWVLFNATAVSSSSLLSVFSESNLIAWYRADNTISSNGYVSEWIDLSGNGNHATQPTASLQPLLNLSGFNGKPVISFQNSKYLNLPNCLNSSWGQATLLILYNLDDTSHNWAAAQTGSGSDPYWGANSTFSYSSYFGEFRAARLSQQPASGMSVAGQALVEVSSGPTNGYEIYRNTSLLLNTSTYWGVTTTPTIGRNLSGDNFMNGEIAEFAIINQEITSAQRTAARNYFKNFWNLTLY